MPEGPKSAGVGYGYYPFTGSNLYRLYEILSQLSPVS